MYANRKPKFVRYAFTMIELIVVMLILAIAAAVVVPMASSAGTMQLRAGANVMAADLEYAKSLAVSRGISHAVVFNATAETYQIEDLSKLVGDPNRVIDHPVRSGSKYIMNFGAGSRFNRVDIVSVNFDGASGVAFNYLGSPFAFNGISSSPLLKDGVVTLEVPGGSRTVCVVPVTGFVTVSD